MFLEFTIDFYRRTDFSVKSKPCASWRFYVSADLVVLRMQPRGLVMLGKHTTPELHATLDGESIKTSFNPWGFISLPGNPCISMEVWSPHPFLSVSSHRVTWGCYVRACAYARPPIFLGGISFPAVMPLLHQSAWERWMTRLLSFLFLTIMIVSCGPIYSCQVFLHAINLPHLCTRSVSYSLFHTAQTYIRSFIHLVLILDDMQTASVCVFGPAICLPDTAFCCSDNVCHLGSQKIFFPGLSLFTFCNVQTASCHGTCSKSMLTLRVL